MGAVGWLDPAMILDTWADAPDDPELTAILTAAHEQCAAYFPGDPDTAPVTESMRLAQLLQAQHLWARKQSGNRDTLGPDGYMVQTWPLVMESRQLLRPKHGNPFRGLL